MIDSVRGILLSGWTPKERVEIEKILSVLPRAFVEELPTFKRLKHEDVLTDAPPTAPGHSKYDGDSGTIVVYDKGVYHDGKIDPEQFRRSVYHELAHAIVRHQPRLLNEWIHDTRGDGFVDDYARSGPEEDYADTFSEYLLHRAGVRDAVPKKAQFMRRLFTQASFR